VEKNPAAVMPVVSTPVLVPRFAAPCPTEVLPFWRAVPCSMLIVECALFTVLYGVRLDGAALRPPANVVNADRPRGDVGDAADVCLAGGSRRGGAGRLGLCVLSRLLLSLDPMGMTTSMALSMV